MAKQPVSLTRWHGGLSPDNKEGPEHSFAYSRHIDFRKKPTGLSILPKTVKETGTTVTELITDMLQLPSGKMVAIGDAGGVYVRTTSGVWSKDGTTLTDTACGMVYNLQHDTIYIAGLQYMHSITNADGRFSGGTFTVNDKVFGPQVDQSATGHANTYTTLSSISETSANRLTFIPAIEPLYSIKVWVTTKGTGDVTFTLHDAANNKLGEVTKTAAQLVNGELNEIVFTNVRMSVRPNASQYHVHVTHSTSGGGTSTTIGTSTSSDLSTAEHETYSYRFVDPINNFHPMENFLQYICIANERYLAVWEPISQTNPTESELEQHRLIFPTGYEVCGIEQWNEYLAVAVEKRSTSATNEFQDGRIFLWNGTDTNWTDQIPVPEGAPYGLKTFGNRLMYIAGNALYAWAGGEPQKVFQFPNTDTEYTDAEQYTVINPHMLAVRNGILIAGFPSVTNSASIEHGLYSYGARMKNYSPSFGYSYTISTGNRTNGTLRIGMVKSFGDKLFVSWRDGSNYGVDVVSPNSDPFATATIETLLIDGSRPDKYKMAADFKLTFEALPIGATVTPKYKIDRESSWQTGTAAVAGDTEITLNINKRFKEIQLGMDIEATTTSPQIISATLIADELSAEAD